MSQIPPIRREVLVDAGPATAFEIFTERIGSWWPADKSVFGEGSTVAFTDGRLVEQARRLATDNDVSVASGFFTATVRHWQVGLTGR